MRRPARFCEALESRYLLSATPLISEFLAINNTGLADENGDHSDWVELYNPGGSDVNLGGYYLSDDANNLTKWQMPAVTLASGGYLTVFADGKDRRTVGSPLHTNFSIAGGGGFLGLAAPDGSTLLSQYSYPQQVADISYGVSVSQDVTKLIAPGAASHVLVPQNTSLGTTWKDATFNDSAWPTGPTGVGYETESIPPLVGGFQVRMVDTNGGTDGNINDIGEATQLLDGTLPSGSYIIAFDGTVNRPSINMGDGGFFGNDQTLPNGLGGTSADNTAPGRTQYALRIASNLTIPAGQYTIDVSSDDGFRLRIPGVTFTNRNGENLTGAVNPSPADTLVYGAPRGQANTFATFTVPAGGLTAAMQLDYFEQGGGDEVELSVATGQWSSFNTTAFQLLQDGLYGWAVKDPSSVPPPNYRSLIGTDVQSAMYNLQNTAYVRIPFNVPDPSDFDTARLQVKYDDGFIAYLNGTEIARRNAPATAVWNSAATATHPDASALVYESFDIPLANLLMGTNVLAVQGLNAAADQSDFLVYPEIQGLFNTVGSDTYFSTPTPGAPNSAPNNLTFVADTKFNFNRGFYSAPFQLAITTATVGASIRYTTDGTLPTPTHGAFYTGPFQISSTTTLRAMAYKTGMQPTNVDTESYIFMSDVIHQSPAGQAPAGFPVGPVNGQIFNYGMDPNIVNADPSLISHMQSIPSVSVVMDPKDLVDPSTGIYTHATLHGRAWERPTSIEFLYADGTTPDIQSNAGIRIRGGYSRDGSNPKHGFHFYFRSQYGDSSFNHPIMGPSGTDSFNQFDLRTFENYSWSFGGDSRFTGLRDQFSRDTQLAMGWQGERGDFYNLYINGQYWGIYNTAERAEADFGASYFGGSSADYDTVKVATDLGYTIEATDGDLNAWTSLWTQAQGDMTNNANYQKLLGNNPDGTRNPNYPILLDPKNLIDYMLLIYYTGNLDAPLSSFINNNGGPNNFFAVRNRNGNMGFQFFAHDSEHTFLDVNADRTGPFPINTAVSTSNPQWLFQMLVANPEFKQLVADRIQKYFFDGGLLMPTSVGARLGIRRDQINQAIYGESARWGDSKHTPAYTHTDWQNEINRIYTSYIPQRTGIVINQFKARGWFSSVAAPTYSQFGGTVPANYHLTMTNPNGAGTIYYTLDGTDPRLPGGAVSPTAQVYSGAFININQTRNVKARVLNNGTWSAVEDATFTLDTSALRVTEVMYHPLAPPTGSPYTADDFEFIELFNSGSTALDLSAMQFTKGVTLTFSSGTSLAAGQRAVVVKNPAAFQSRYGTAITILATYTDKLSDKGEEVTLIGAASQTIFDFTYDDTWYPLTDGGGYSLVVRNPLADPATLNDPNSWRASNDLNGKPGGADPGTVPGTVVINEILTSTDQPGGDWVELYNTTATPLDLSGWFLSDSIQDLRKYQIQPGTTIAAHAYLVFHAASTFGQASNPGVATPFGLDSAGDSIHLSSVDSAGNAGGYQVQEDFAGSDPEVTFGRYTNSAGKTYFTALLTPTPGSANSVPRVGSVVINELMYYPPTGQEFIELRNLTSQALALYDPNHPQDPWKFTDGIDYSLPANASIPAFGYALIVGNDPVQFRTQNNVPASVPIFGPYTAADGTNVLNNGGERVSISKPMAPDPSTGVVPYIIVDSVNYDVAAPWPASPHGTGPSLARISGISYGDEPRNWQAGPTGGTPGTPNLPNTPPAVNAFSGATINEGGVYSATGSFTDPDNDPGSSWTATVDYGDGTGSHPLALSGHNFTLNHLYADNNPPGSSAAYTATVIVTDIAGANATASAQVTVNNVPPSLSISGSASAAINGPYTLTLSSTDPGQDTISSWSINWGDGPAQVVTGNPPSVPHTYTATGPYVISATATDEDGTYSANSLPINVVPPGTVLGRQLFYNHSFWNDPTRGFTDDNAIDLSKSALLAGGTATFANYTGSSMGINGVMVDIAALPTGTPTASDFTFKVGNSNDPTTWVAAPAPTSIVVRRAAGIGGSDRIELIWADNAIQDEWLQVTVNADAATGSSSPDVFYFGNAIGETGDSTTDTFINGGDFVGVRDHPANFVNRAQVGNPYDFNHDSFVDGTDLIITRDNVNNFLTALKLITPPAGASAPAAAAARQGAAPAAPAPSVLGAGPSAVSFQAQSHAVTTPFSMVPIVYHRRRRHRLW